MPLSIQLFIFSDFSTPNSNFELPESLVSFSSRASAPLATMSAIADFNRRSICLRMTALL